MRSIAACCITAFFLLSLSGRSALGQANLAAPLPVYPHSDYHDAVRDTRLTGRAFRTEGSGLATTYAIGVRPKHGTLTLAEAQQGSWSYTPEAGFIGQDEFRLDPVSGQNPGPTRVVINLTPPVSRKSYYVEAGTGIDTNPGTKAKPFASIQAAENVTCPGDIVFIRSGTYLDTSNEGVVTISRSGLPGAMITYKAYPGERPVLHAVKAWNHVLITASYIRVEGLEIAGNARNVSQPDAEKVADRFIQGSQFESYGPETSAYQTNGISIRAVNQKLRPSLRLAPRHIEIVKNTVYDVQGGGVSAMDADYILFKENVIHDTSYRAMYATSGISVLGSLNTDEIHDYKIIILRNLVYRNRTEVKWNHTKALSDGNGIIIDSNRIKDDPATGPFRGRMLVADNIVYENGGAGIQVYSSDDVDVLNNTVVHNSLTPGLNYGQIWVHQASHVAVENNISVAGEGAKNNEAFKDTVGVVYDYNLYFGGRRPEILGASDRIADPKFVDETQHDFRLSADSPALHAGNLKFAFGEDFTGRPRTGDAAIDLGALIH